MSNINKEEKVFRTIKKSLTKIIEESGFGVVEILVKDKQVLNIKYTITEKINSNES